MLGDNGLQNGVFFNDQLVPGLSTRTPISPKGLSTQKKSHNSLRDTILKPAKKSRFSQLANYKN